MSIELDIYRKVNSLFIWTSDKIIHPDYFDHWQSHADEVERGEVFRDDCDGFSLTCAELFVRNPEVKKEDVKIIYCLTELGGGHLVASFKNLILDNRQRTVYPWTGFNYKWKSSMRMSEPGVWRTMEV